MSEFTDRDPIPRDDGRFWGKLDDYALRVVGATHGRDTYFIPGPGGRRLAVETSGNEDGHTVILFHGKPGSRTGPRLRGDMLWRMGINLVTYDRPGYGYSDPNPGRRPVDSIDDLRTITEFLNIENGFSVVGRSGGGPHALACAAGLQGVKNVASLASRAPQYELGDRKYDGLGSHNTRALEMSTDQLRVDLTDHVKNMHADPRTLLELLRPDFDKDDRDLVVGQLEAELLRTWSEGIQFGPEGWIEDCEGEKDWGFDPRDIAVPALIWYGGRDPFSPSVNGKWLAGNIPNAEDAYYPVASHFRASLEIVPAVLGWCATGNFNLSTNSL